jgi:4-hydroxybenzoate polyprenyltransferase
VAALAIFFRLRVFDEIKDCTTDRHAHPDRPLARGLISLTEAKVAAFSCLAFEGACSAVLGQAAFAAWSLVAGYSLLMYREFFIGWWLRPRLTTYAVMHTLVACWIAAWTFCAATGRAFADMPASYAQLVLANWAVFNLFEFGRKTFGVEEERGPDESYSKRFGPAHAAANVLLMAVPASGLAVSMGRALNLPLVFAIGHAGLLSVLGWTAWRYVRSNNAPRARAFRSSCGAYLLLYQVLLIAGILLS